MINYINRGKGPKGCGYGNVWDMCLQGIKKDNLL